MTWEECANVKFEKAKSEKDANIRITFKGDIMSTAIGTDADSYKPDSMSLNGLDDKYPPSLVGRGDILHEFGHALGLEHEHQSPSAADVVTLDEKMVRDHYAKQGTPQQPIEGQRSWEEINIIDRIQEDETRNYTNMDTASIMM